MRNWLINTEGKKLDYYKGMLIHADTGVHEQAAVLVKKSFPAGASVLDVGAGAGAFSQRLADLGFRVTALDVDPEKWVPKEIPFVQLNIDTGIAASVPQVFDAACCLEVVEHVENPWNLLREIHRVVKPGGYLLLSTPNITSFLSRSIFFLTGQFHQFEEGDHSYGHISPISAFELEYAARQSGWEVLDIIDGGSLSVFDFAEMRPLKLTLAKNVLSGLAYVIGKGHKKGWCLFYLLQRSADRR